MRRLWSKKTPLDEVADKQLDAALERLSHSLKDNSDIGERLRKRQSSGSLRLISVPMANVLEAE